MQDTARTDVKLRLFYKHGRIWITDKRTIEGHVLNRINDCYDVFFRGQTELLSHTRNMKQAEVILKYVMNHATPRPGFVKQLWQSTIGKICYEDGFYDFVAGAFYKWGSPEDPMTTVIILLAFPKRPTDETRNQLLKMLTPVFNDKDCMRDCILQFFVRSIAGMVVDKQWMV